MMAITEPTLDGSNDDERECEIVAAVGAASQTEDKQPLAIKVPIMTRFLYSLPSLPLSIAAVFLPVFVPKLYTDTYGVPISSIGLISIGALVFNALTDPIVGFLSDQTRTRWGRRRPYIFIGGVLLACFGGALLAPAPGLSISGLTTWACLFILLVVLSATLLRVPWFALGVEMTAGVHEEKTAVFATREAVFIVGSLIGAGLPIIAAAVFPDGTDDETKSLIEAERRQFRFIAAIVAVISLLAVGLCVRFVREERYAELVAAGGEEGARTKQEAQSSGIPDGGAKDTQSKGAGSCSGWGGACHMIGSYRTLLGDLLSTRAGLSLFVSSTIYSGATSLNGFFFSYFVEYAVGAEDYLELVLIVYILSGVLCIPLWVKIGQRRLEKFQLLLIAMVIQTLVLYLAFFLIGDGDLYVYLAVVALAGCSFGGSAAIKFSMIGDLADVDEAQNGYRREGEIQGAFDLFGKLVAAFLIGPTVFILDNAGYSPNTAQPEDALLVIRVCYSLVPAIMGTLALFALVPYNLSRQRYQSIVSQP